MRDSVDHVQSRHDRVHDADLVLGGNEAARGPAADDAIGRSPWWHKLVGPLLGASIDTAMRWCCRVEVYGAEYLRYAPGALVVSNHRRDTDGPIVGGILLQRSGLRLHGVRPFFVAREDLFRRGFLLQYLEGWPRPLRRVLGALALGPVLRSIQLLPMRRIRERNLLEVLEDVLEVLGDRPLDQVLRPEGVLRLARHTTCPPHELTVRRALQAQGALLYERHAFRRLNLEALRALTPFERRMIDTQLGAFVTLLEKGATVLLEPEGTISMDGSFMRPRRALHTLLNGPARPPHLLPVALSYDFMTARRARVLVRFGSPRTDLAGLERRKTDDRVKEAVLKQCMVTASQLTGRYLRDSLRGGVDTLTTTALEAYIKTIATRCQRTGVPVDPVLVDGRRRRRRVRECLLFCRRRGIVTPAGDGVWRVDGRLGGVPPSRFHADGIIGYLNNEVESIASIRPELFSDDRL